MIRRLTNSRGFSLVEVMVSLAIVVLLLVSVYGLIIQSLKLTEENKLKLSATILAEQKIERIRNLPYDSIGTTAGIPNGSIPDNEVVSNPAGSFSVNTVVLYVDDAFDGVAPADLLPTDYKSVRVRVSWTGPFGDRSETVFTKIAPRGMETSPGGGTLVITVFNAVGIPVDLADVVVVNSSVSPAVNITLQTATSGAVVIPGAPESIEGYQITVSKAGYSTSSTTARTAANPNPTQTNVTVLNDQKTEVFYQIDLLSTLTIKAISQNLPENYKINTDTSGEDQTNPRLALDNSGNVYVVWQDYRQGSAAKIFAQKYSGGVAQWAGDKLIGAANNQILPDILIDESGNGLYIAWSDDDGHAGNQDAYLVKLQTSTGNDLWGGSNRIDTAADNMNQTKPRLALAPDGDLIVVWQDNRAGNDDIYAIRYRNDHATEWSEFKVNSDSGSSNQTTPVVVGGSDDKTYVAWTDERNGNQDIYAQKLSSTSTKLWAGDYKLDSSGDSSNQYYVNLAVDGDDNLYAVWTDERNGSDNRDVYAQKVASSSQTKLWGTDLIVNTDGLASTSQYSPAIAIDASDIAYVVWIDERYGNQDIYAQKIDPNANRLWSPDLRVNVNVGTSDQTNPDVTINPATGKPYASWQDNRNSDMDIYATEFDDYGSATNLANVPITVTGAKKIGEDPIIYKYSRSFTTDSLGTITLANMEWDTYTITETSATYSIVMSNPPIPAILDPNTSLLITLYME